MPAIFYLGKLSNPFNWDDGRDDMAFGNLSVDDESLLVKMFLSIDIILLKTWRSSYKEQNVSLPHFSLCLS